MKHLRTFVSALLAGISIALGGSVFLALENRVYGALLFTVGLFTICSFGLNLFTGKVCYVFENDRSYALSLPIIWLGNFAGTWLAGLALRLTRQTAMVEKAAELSRIKTEDSLLSLFILSLMCNILIYIAVEGYRSIPHAGGKYIALFFGVSVFILCGFEHCVANMFYFSAGGAWNARSFICILVMTAGNAVGGVIFPLLRRFIQKSENQKTL